MHCLVIWARAIGRVQGLCLCLLQKHFQNMEKRLELASTFWNDVLYLSIRKLYSWDRYYLIQIWILSLTFVPLNMIHHHSHRHCWGSIPISEMSTNKTIVLLCWHYFLTFTHLNFANFLVIRFGHNYILCSPFFQPISIINHRLLLSIC